MKEDFLCYIWKFRLFTNNVLLTADGRTLQILKTGEQNQDSGPDFFNARLIIGDTEWAGNVEIDLTSSEWFKHGHHTNKAFSKIILHVVYEINKPLNHQVPVLELKNYIDKQTLTNYNLLQQAQEKIPCQKHLKTIDSFALNAWLERLIIDRIETKSTWMEKMLVENKYNWENTFYQALARNFGFKTNAVPFELVAQNTPLSVLAKHKNNLNQLEAILFGQAGFLQEPATDEYHRRLQQEYTFLVSKFTLQAIDKSLWKFARLHPANFPTIRIAQFATLIHQSSHLFSKIIETDNLTTLIDLFKIQPTNYWLTHFYFGNETTYKKKELGIHSIENILINTVVPFLFIYGKNKNQEMYRERALSLLEKIKPENNFIIKQWAVAGISAKNARESQSLIHLKNNYCTMKKCLACAIGIKILKSNESIH